MANISNNFHATLPSLHLDENAVSTIKDFVKTHERPHAEVRSLFISPTSIFTLLRNSEPNRDLRHRVQRLSSLFAVQDQEDDLCNSIEGIVVDHIPHLVEYEISWAGALDDSNARNENQKWPFLKSIWPAMQNLQRMVLKGAAPMISILFSAAIDTSSWTLKELSVQLCRRDDIVDRVETENVLQEHIVPFIQSMRTLTSFELILWSDGHTDENPWDLKNFFYALSQETTLTTIMLPNTFLGLSELMIWFGDFRDLVNLHVAVKELTTQLFSELSTKHPKLQELHLRLPISWDKRGRTDTNAQIIHDQIGSIENELINGYTDILDWQLSHIHLYSSQNSSGYLHFHTGTATMRPEQDIFSRPNPAGDIQFTRAPAPKQWMRSIENGTAV